MTRFKIFRHHRACSALFRSTVSVPACFLICAALVVLTLLEPTFGALASSGKAAGESDSATAGAVATATAATDAIIPDITVGSLVEKGLLVIDGALKALNAASASIVPFLDKARVSLPALGKALASVIPVEGLARDIEIWSVRLTAEKADLEVLGRDSTTLLSAAPDPSCLEGLGLEGLNELRSLPGRLETRVKMFTEWAFLHGAGAETEKTRMAAAREEIERARAEGRAFLEEQQRLQILESSTAARDSMRLLGADLVEVYKGMASLVSGAATALEAGDIFKGLILEGQARKQQALEARLAQELQQGKKEEKRLDEEQANAARELEAARDRAGREIDDPLARAELGMARLKMSSAALKMEILRLREEVAGVRLGFEKDRFSFFRLKVRMEKREIPEPELREEKRKIEERIGELLGVLEGIERESGRYSRELEETGAALDEERLRLATLSEKGAGKSKKAAETLRQTVELRGNALILQRERAGLVAQIRDILERNREELLEFSEKRIVYLLWGNTTKQFMWFALALLGVFAVSSIFRWMVRDLVVSVFSKSRFKFDEVMAEALNGPVTMAVMVAGSYFAFGTLHLTQAVRVRLDLFFESLAIVNIAFLFYRACDIVSFFLQKIVARTETSLDDQMLPLLRKAVKGLIVFAGLTLVLENVGYHVTSLVTGLGLGGLAFALAAKDTLSNFFGSLMIFTDKPFGLGDWVIFNGFEGIVEDIGIRSTKVRTWKDTMVTVPNSTIASASIENVSMFRSRRVSMTLRLRLDTPPEKIERAVELFREVLNSRPDVKDDHYIFFTDIGTDSHEIMIYYFAKSTVWRTYLEIRQQVFLEILGRFRQEGIRLALPAEAKVDTRDWGDVV